MTNEPAPAPRPAGIRSVRSILVEVGGHGTVEVEVRVSTRRTKSASGHLEAGKVVVVVPARCTVAEREELAARLARRLVAPARGRTVASDAALERRAASLGDRYLDGVRPSSIRFVTNQQRRWGSCSPATGAIRLSARLRHLPEYVLDGVIVHELAHLIEPAHSARFAELVARYPRLAEAEAYLAGFEQGASTAGMDLGPVPAERWGSEATVETTPAPPSLPPAPRRRHREPDRSDGVQLRLDDAG